MADTPPGAPARFTVTARKYRPQTFDDLVAQEHVAETLRNAITRERLAHAYLFSGPRGVGKTTAARILAKAVNCQTPLDQREGAEPCRTCDSCAAFEAGRSLNIIEIDAASNNRVEDIRELRDTVRVPPQGAKKKVYILDEVHMLSASAFNALLKTLEEPPEYALFIFATTEPHKVLPTILSRTQRFDFRRIAVPEIVDRLREICAAEHIAADDESLVLLARKGDGALRDALSLFDQAVSLCGADLRIGPLREALGVVDADVYFVATDRARTGDRAGLLSLVDHVVRSGHDLNEFVLGFADHLRNLLVARSTGTGDLIEGTEATRARYLEAAAPYAEADLLHLLLLAETAATDLRESRQPRLTLELALLKMASLERAADLGRLLDRLQALETAARTGKLPESPLTQVKGTGASGPPTADGGRPTEPGPRTTDDGRRATPSTPTAGGGSAPAPTASTAPSAPATSTTSGPTLVAATRPSASAPAPAQPTAAVAPTPTSAATTATPTATTSAPSPPPSPSSQATSPLPAGEGQGEETPSPSAPTSASPAPSAPSPTTEATAPATAAAPSPTATAEPPSTYAPSAPEPPPPSEETRRPSGPPGFEEGDPGPGASQRPSGPPPGPPPFGDDEGGTPAPPPRPRPVAPAPAAGTPARPRRSAASLFGAPALKRSGGDGASNALGAIGDGQSGDAPDAPAGAGPSMDAVAEAWPRFIATVRSEIGVRVGTIVKVSQPLRVALGAVEVGMEDAFGVTVAEQNEDALLKVLAGVLGGEPPPIRWVVAPDDATPETARAADPFDTLKQMRQEHPVVRALFEQFGAEIVWQ